MFVFFPFILDIKFVGRTSRGHTGFLIHLSAVRALIFLARRIQSFLSLVDREVELCVLTIGSDTFNVGVNVNVNVRVNFDVKWYNANVCVNVGVNVSVIVIVIVKGQVMLLRT